MARKFILPIILNPRSIRPLPNNLESAHQRTLHTEVSVKEIKIPVKWGHVAAKLWGNENEQPILALHGWQDNAGTWDPLAPLICHKRPILAIDLPGHGFSSCIPEGMHYNTWDLPRLFLILKNYFNWNKISFLCHSMGSIATMNFASLFPDDVEFYVAIDNLVYDDYDKIGRIDENILNNIQDLSDFNGEPPSYTLEEIIKAWHIGSGKSIAMKSVHHLLKRGSKPSSKDPNKYHFSRDPRLKQVLFIPESRKLFVTFAKKISCPTLLIKGIDSPYVNDKFSGEIRTIIEKNNKDFQSHFVPGTHHLHLNNPEIIAPLITNFIDQYSNINLDRVCVSKCNMK